MNFKNIYQVVSLILFLIGLFFTYLIAETDDAPGFIIIGSAVVGGACLLLFGLGSLIELIKSNNKILMDIYNEIKNKNN
jgi:uncharacterized membrane protein